MISELIPDISRKCKGCQIEKPQSEYYTDDPRTTWTSRRLCKDCYNAKRRIRRNGELIERQCEVCQRTFLPIRLRNATTCSQSCRCKKAQLRKYGLTFKRFRELNDQQNGRCAICRKKPKRERLIVHHCHNTSVFLGLVCRNCNIGLGMFNDSPKLLQRALDFAEGTVLFSKI